MIRLESFGDLGEVPALPEQPMEEDDRRAVGAHSSRIDEEGRRSHLISLLGRGPPHSTHKDLTCRAPGC